MYVSADDEGVVVAVVVSVVVSVTLVKNLESVVTQRCY